MKNLLCFFLGHKWEAWKTENSCKDMRVCRRCKRQEHKTEQCENKHKHEYVAEVPELIHEQDIQAYPEHEHVAIERQLNVGHDTYVIISCEVCGKFLEGTHLL